MATPIDRGTVLSVAQLARLALDDGQVAELASELGRILEHVQKLEELDVRNVPPLTHGTGGTDVYREDVPGPVLPREDALRSASDVEDGFFRVPRVIEEA